MFSIGLIAVVLIVVSVGISLYAYIDGGIIASIVSLGVTSLIGSVLWLLSVLMVQCHYLDHDDNYFTTSIVSELNIKSLKPADGMRGSFVLGSGSVSSEGYFYTLAEVDEGVFQKRKYSINDTFLKETGNHKIIEYRKDYYNKRYTWLTGGGKVYDRTIYMLEVPKGTIIENYEVM